MFIGCAIGESTISPAFHELNPEKVALVDISGDIRGEAPKNQVEDYIDAETAEVLWVGTSRGGSGQGLASVGGAIGGALLGSQVGSGTGRVVGGIAGGVLGGTAGQALSPQTARVVQKAIKQMVEGLPNRK